jgi:restriction system protein
MEFLLLGFAVAFVLWALERAKSPERIGAVGEARVDAKLRRDLGEVDYEVFQDLIIPTVNGTTQIDNLVISRFGIFVIETKNMSGWIFGSADQANWTQVLHRKKFRLQNPLRQNYKHVKAVEQVFGFSKDTIHSVDRMMLDRVGEEV